MQTPSEDRTTGFEPLVRAMRRHLITALVVGLVVFGAVVAVTAAMPSNPKATATVQDKDGNEIDMRQNFDDEETGFDMRDVAGSETVTNENELLNDYTIKDADAGFDDPSVLEDDNSAAAESASDEVNIDE